MKKQHYNRLKSKNRALRLTVKEVRAVNDRRIINDLRQQLRAATVEKTTEMDVLISKLRAAAKVMAEQARQERVAIAERLRAEY